MEKEQLNADSLGLSTMCRTISAFRYNSKIDSEVLFMATMLSLAPLSPEPFIMKSQM